MQLTSSLNLQQESLLPCVWRSTSLTARAPHTCTRTQGKSAAACITNPQRVGWGVGDEAGGMDGGNRWEAPGEAPGNPGNKRKKAFGTDSRRSTPKSFLLHRPPSLPPSPLLTSISFSLPHVSVFFPSPLFHSLRWRLPVAMATAEEETIPEERRRGCQRSRLRREDVLRCSGWQEPPACRATSSKSVGHHGKCGTKLWALNHSWTENMQFVVQP